MGPRTTAPEADGEPRPQPATLDRRRFLQGTVAGAALTLTGAGCGASASYDASELAVPDLLAAFGSDLVRAIGERYRTMVPAEGNADVLHSAILASRPWLARLPWASEPTIEELVLADFARDDIVVVDGWVLSVTEARQCALYSLRPA